VHQLVPVVDIKGKIVVVIPPIISGEMKWKLMSSRFFQST
jgi:hypothetical protein